MENKTFLTLKDSARLLDVNERTMKNILDKNKNILSFSKLGGRYLINKDSLLQIINSNSLNY